jgi:oxygen-independent coproporphyrinogen-3 oxidase
MPNRQADSLGTSGEPEFAPGAGSDANQSPTALPLYPAGSSVPASSVPSSDTSPAVPDLPIDTPAALYVHVPYCHTKCGYCDFYSLPLAHQSTSRMAASLVAELTARLASCPHPVQTIFCGGGTPTVLPIDDLAALLAPLAEVVARPEVIEFTVEANPGTIDREKAELLRQSGVTRMSLGAQSFDPEELRALERIHRPGDVERSVAVLREAGFDDLNLDLIFGIPGQTAASWARSLEQALALEPQHIAAYGLTYEPGTPLEAQRDRGAVRPCDEGLEAELYVQLLDTLSAAGYEAYEISNFAQPGRTCRHNLLYWRNRPYIGVGPSAVGCWGRRRYRNVPDVAAYVAAVEAGRPAVSEEETLDDAAVALEMLLMQLRTAEGLEWADFQTRVGEAAAAALEDPVTRLTAAGLLASSDTHVALTRAGRLVANRVLTELAGALPDGG